MSLNNIKIVDINTENLASSDFGSNSEVDVISSNLDSFASYANSTFSTGPSFEAGQLLDAPILYTDSSNANSAYATSNVISIFTAVNSGDNLLVYLDGLLQHPDTYVVSGDSIQFANVDPLPANVSVGVRYLATPSTLIANTAIANTTISANGSLLWDYESKRLYVYDGVTEGGFYANATPAVGYSFQGSISGYTSGAPPANTTIDKFPFSADANATDVGDLSQGRNNVTGQSSITSGYSSGGTTAPTSVQVNTIDKFPFSADSNASDVGDLTQARRQPAGQSSAISGYASGGGNPGGVNTIDKFPFAADANATDVGDLTLARGSRSGQSSDVSGYTSGDGNPILVSSNTIDKFPFAADSNATDVGDLTVGRFNGIAGQSSTISGYASGGGNPSGVNTIDKFPFSTDANATDVGDLTQARTGAVGQSSINNGYTSGGDVTIDKFPFSTDANATDVGDLSIARNSAAGQQV